MNVSTNGTSPSRAAVRNPAAKKILLCALTDGIAATAMKALSNDDQAFCVAPDATEALRSMDEECPSVVIVGGPSTQAVADSCRQLRAAATCKDAVILAVASERPEDAGMLLDAGADDFLESLGEEALRSRILVAQRAAATITSRRLDSARFDVTEEALRELSESLATTLNSIGDGVIATDLGGTIIRMNPVAEQLTGWTKAEAKGLSLLKVLPLVNEDTRARVDNPIGQALREGAVVALARHTLLTRRDGSEIPIADSCAPIRSGNGVVNGAVLVFRDLTAQRTAEANQAKFQEHMVFADRMAAVGTLAAGVAHEINNPMSYVVSNLDTAIEEVRAIGGGSVSSRMKELEDMLVEARQGVGRVTKIVRGLKTFSRIEEERSAVIEVFPVLDLSINMAFNEIRHRARLVKDYGPLPSVDADDARLGQVFINLLVNAAHAFPARTTGAEEIRIVTSTDPSGRAVVEVSDNGPGIPAAIVGRVFDPFFTTKPIGVGTGLGLSISHNIVTGMGGEISVQSEVGKGTTFRVVLPAASQEGKPGTIAEASPRRDSTPPAKVLVVDDEPSIGHAIRRVLWHDDVTVVTTAQQALDLLAAGKNYDVVLSDLMMPGMSGMDLYRTLVERHPDTAPKVVFVTGGAFTPDANAFLDRVSNERMNKPFDSHELRDLVRKFTK